MKIQNLLLILSVLSCVLDFFIVNSQSNSQCEPLGVHISFGEFYYMFNIPGTTIFYLQYYTESKCAENKLIIYDQNQSNSQNEQNIQLYDHNQPLNSNSSYLPTQPFKKYIHTISIKNLNGYGKKYMYYIIYDQNNQKGPYYFIFSRPFHFFKELNQVLVIADFDQSQYSLPTQNALFDIAQHSLDKYRAIIHAGDISQDLYQNYGEDGLQFMQMAENFAAFIPYMTIPGNHEKFDDFSYYRAFFKNPHHSPEEYPTDLVYSWNVGNMHFIGMNLDDYDQSYHIILRELENDLLNATHKTVRDEYPWIIVYVHQPLYCSLIEPEIQVNHCEYNLKKFEQIEELFYKYQVDLVVQGHIHMYERTYPVYKTKIQQFKSQLHNYKEEYYEDCNFDSQKSKCNVFENPQAPIYVIEGVAGNSHYAYTEQTFSKYKDNLQQWSAFMGYQVGYGIISSSEDNFLTYQHLSSEDNSVIDKFEIIQRNRQPFRDNSSIIPYFKKKEHGIAEIMAFVLMGIIGLGLGIGVIFVVRNFLRWKNVKKLIQFEEQDFAIKPKKNSFVQHYELKNIDDTQ